MTAIDFIVLAHTRPAQVRRLLARLAPLGGTTYLHVDAPEPQRFAGDADVELLRSRPAPWGSFGLVEATLDGLRASVERGTASHVVLLSGADYPIKPAEAIAGFFAERPDESFMEAEPLPRATWLHGGLPRINRWHLRRVSLPPVRVMPRRTFRRFPDGVTPYGGSQWWAMSRACAEQIVRFDAERPDVRAFFRRTLLPDELFFQTVVMSSPQADLVRQGGVHYLDWADGAHPATLTLDDVPALERSPMLFARKFEDEAVLDAVDKLL